MDKPPGVGPKTQSRPTVPPRPGTKPGTKGRPMPASQAAAPSKASADVGRPVWYKRKYLVYPKFQMPLIILNSMVTIFLFSLVAYLVIRSHLYLEQLVKQTRLPAQNLFIQLLTEQLRSLLIYMAIALVIGVSSTATLTLLLSHKMAGPMIRLKNFFANITKSSEFPEQLKFREGDFFQELPPTVNGAFNALKKKWQR